MAEKLEVKPGTGAVPEVVLAKKKTTNIGIVVTTRQVLVDSVGHAALGRIVSASPVPEIFDFAVGAG